MNQLPFTLTPASLTIFVDGLPTTVLSGTVQYNQLREAILKNDWDAIPGLLAPGGALAKYLGDRFSIKGDVISYDGVDLPVELNSRISAMANEGLDPSPMLRFYERLHKNPSFRSRTQAYRFMQHNNISVEPDGTFLAYKGVNDNFTDCHTGTISNAPGVVNQMARNLISDDPDKTCHFGFHVGAKSYADSFGPTVVICRIDPENIVCVPNDHNAQKMRVCLYEVIGVSSGETMPMNADDSDLPDEEYDYDDEDLVEDPDDADEEDLTDNDPPADLLTRGDLVPGTVYAYRIDGDDSDLSFTYAVGNLRLPGAPAPAMAEVHPSGDAAVVVVWSPGQSTFPAEVPVEVETVIKKVAAPRLDKLDTKGLMERSIEDLRRYASGRLKIHGASKIPGGKSALVSKIMRVRRRLAK